MKRPRGASSTVSTHSLWIVPPADPRPAVCVDRRGLRGGRWGARGRRLLRARGRGFWSCGSLVSRETCGLESAGRTSSWPAASPPDPVAPLARLLPWIHCFPVPAAGLLADAASRRVGLRCFRVSGQRPRNLPSPVPVYPCRFRLSRPGDDPSSRRAVRPPELMSTPMQWDHGVMLTACPPQRMAASANLPDQQQPEVRWVCLGDVDARETSSSSPPCWWGREGSRLGLPGGRARFGLSGSVGASCLQDAHDLFGPCGIGCKDPMLLADRGG